MRRISLALVLHNHQPVGNFGWVFAEVYERAYEPLVAALERHPGIRVGLHYSGPLLEWLRAERPTFIERLRGLADREQVEILGGGLYEPVLASLPERDRVGQLGRMADEIEAIFGRRPAGAWLAERVWEPDLPTSLAAAGYGWTILDDAHFRAATIAEDAMWGPYTTDDQGRLLTVFGTERGLRYRIPFQPVEDVIGYLRDNATEDGRRLGTMGDDGEKFGAWPTTWDHCWGEGRWVERFFDALDGNAEWLTTLRPRDWLADHPPVGRIYVPTGSYEEMGGWALPADESLGFTAALEHDRAIGAPEARWLRGAFWRNFQVRYREINDLHKQMLRVSAKVEAMADGSAKGSALDHLYRGQSNDCYWHGLFGGIYLAHMRAATLAHLIAAEDLADAAAGGSAPTGALLDLDLDGRDEVRLATNGQIVTLDLDEGGGIGAWDLRAARHAVTGVLRRRPEAYHDLLRRHEEADGALAASIEAEATEAAASIHGAVRTTEPGLAARLAYDAYERRSALIRILPSGATAADWAAGGGPDLGDLVAGPHELVRLDGARMILARDGSITGLDGVRQELRIEKEVGLGGRRLDPTLRVEIRLENRSDRPLEVRCGIEWATTMLGGGANPDAWWDVAGRRSRHDSSGRATDVAVFAQGNDWLGLAIEASVTPTADLWWAPIETISNSESGFERVYQGSAWLVSWVLSVPARGQWAARIDQRTKITRDRAEDA